MAGVQKAKYWWAVLYPDNMHEDWEERIADEVQVPYAYCVHSKDTDSKSEHRKDHVHLILVFPNTTTYKHALNIFKLLGERAVNTCKAVINIRHAYDYLIHDTEACRKAGKHLYAKEERAEGNGFDIGSYEQLTQEDKNEMLQEMFDFCVEHAIPDVTTFYIDFPNIRDPRYFDVFKSYSGAIERICKGNYIRLMRSACAPSERHIHGVDMEQHVKACPNCGSVNFVKRGKTASDQQRYKCNDCGKTFVSGE